MSISPRTRTWAATALATATAGLLTAAVVHAQLTDDDAGGSDPLAAPQVVAVGDAEQAAFAVLRRDQRAGDAIDTDVAGPAGANLRLARAVATPAGTLRVVPADGQVCLRAEDEVGSLWTCAPTEQAAKEGVLLTSRSQANLGLLAAYAVLPDGAHDVSVSGPSGERAVSVVDNVVASTVSSDTTLSFVDAAGERHRVALP